MATKLNSSIRYQEKSGKGFGGLIISGLTFPSIKDFDPLAKIWSSVRKRICERWQVDVVGLFVYDEKREIVSCSFCLNYGMLPEENHQTYTQRFEDTFQMQMLLFEETLDSFVLDYDFGYESYIKLVRNKNCTPEMCNHFLNSFLKRINIKTEKDERKAAKLATKKAKVMEKLAPYK